MEGVCGVRLLWEVLEGLLHCPAVDICMHELSLSVPRIPVHAALLHDPIIIAKSPVQGTSGDPERGGCLRSQQK